MFTFTVTPDGAAPYEATATSRDIVTWEKGGRGRTFGQLAENPSMVGMYGLAFVTSRRLGLFEGNLSDFEAQVDLDFEEADGDDAADPTQPRHSSTPS